MRTRCTVEALLSARKRLSECDFRMKCMQLLPWAFVSQQSPTTPLSYSRMQIRLASACEGEPYTPPHALTHTTTSRALLAEVAGALLPIDATLLRRATNTSAPKVERHSLGGGMCLATFHLLVSFAEYSIILVRYIIDFTDCWTVSYLAVGWVWILQSHLPKHRYVSIPGNWTLHKCFHVVLLYYFTLNTPQQISAEKKKYRPYFMYLRNQLIVMNHASLLPKLPSSRAVAPNPSTHRQKGCFT